MRATTGGGDAAHGLGDMLSMKTAEYDPNQVLVVTRQGLFPGIWTDDRGDAEFEFKI